MNEFILKPGLLLNTEGELAEAGIATSLVKKYDRNMIKRSKLRIKEWDYYLIYNDDFGVAFTIADNGYMGVGSVTFLDFKERVDETLTPIKLMPMGKFKMPNSSLEGDVSFEHKKMNIKFNHSKAGRRIQLSTSEQMQFEADILLIEEPKESMVIATPFKQRQSFYYNHKIIGFKAIGSVSYRGKEYNLEDYETCGILDWGRGVWTYNNTWYWGAAHGRIGEDSFGFNLGYGFGTTKHGSENALFYNGVSHSLDQTEFKIPIDKSNKEDYLSPWVITSNDQRFEAVFTPIQDRSAMISLGIIKSDQHQVFGHFDGYAVLDGGEKVELKNFFGFAEKVQNKW